MKYVTVPNSVPRPFIVRSPNVSALPARNTEQAIDESSYRVFRSEDITVELPEADEETLKRSPVIDSGHQKLAGLHWYPSSEYLVLPHVEFSLGDDVYDGTVKYRRKARSYAEIVEQARNNGYGFVEFTMNIPVEEFRSIADEILGKSKSFQTCVASACAALNLSKAIYIPPVICLSTALTALYLGIGSFLFPNGNCREITYIGNRSVKNILPIGVIFELFYMKEYFFEPLIKIILNHLS